MFENVISQRERKNLEILKGLSIFNSFYLAGGTGLALWFGHRFSHDLDLFSPEDFNVDRLLNIIKDTGRIKVEKRETGTLIIQLNGSFISFFYYPYKLLENPVDYKGLKLAHWKDILCMKISAISSRGVKRDFYDVYVVLKKKGIGLKDALDYYSEKYSGIDINISHILKSITYFEDADKEPSPQMIENVDWEDVKEFFKDQAKKLFTGHEE